MFIIIIVITILVLAILFCLRAALGTQTRSRVILVAAADSPDVIPCPDDVIETRRCVADGYCPTYSWHASYWLARGGGGNTRHVTCQRSDGLAVYGKTIRYKQTASPYLSTVWFSCAIAMRFYIFIVLV